MPLGLGSMVHLWRGYVDVDAVLALFNPLADDGLVVVVFLPMFDHQKYPKLKCGKPVAKPKNRTHNW